MRGILGSNGGSSPTPTSEEYILIQEQQSSGVDGHDGGGFSSGSRHKRELNTEVVDTDDNATISSNVIALQPGTYRFAFFATGNRCGGHQAFLRNTSDSVDVGIGSTERLSTGTTSHSNSNGSGRFTIAATKNFELQHECTNTNNTDGFGKSGGLGTEVYCQVEFWKEL